MIFEIASGRMVASDPCYKGTVGPIFIDNVANGDWFVSATYGDYHRPSMLVAYHDNFRTDQYPNRKIRENVRWQPLDEGCVDSGQFGFFDHDEWIKHDTPEEKEYDDHTWYGKCCDITLSKSSYGTINDAGVVSSTLYGDGSYPVDVLVTDSGTVVGVRVDFDPEYDDEDAEDWDE